MSNETIAERVPKPACRDLAVGDRIIHKPTRKVATIERRKPDNSGWWLKDGSGIADRAFDTQDDWASLS